MDLRVLAVSLLEEATRALREQHAPGSRDHVLDGGFFKSHDMGSSRRPDLGVGSEEDGDDRSADRGRQVPDAGVVADVEPGGGDPAGQLI